MRRRTFLGGASAAALTAITTAGAAASVTDSTDGGGLPSDVSCEECLDRYDYDTCCGVYCTDCRMQ